MEIRVEDTLAIVADDGKVTRFGVDDNVTVSKKDLTTDQKAVTLSGRINNIMHAEKRFELDCSAQFRSSVVSVDFSDIAGMIVYVAPAATTTTTETKAADTTATTSTTTTAPTTEAVTNETATTAEVKTENTVTAVAETTTVAAPAATATTATTESTAAATSTVETGNETTPTVDGPTAL